MLLLFSVFNGTGANSVALQAVTRPFNSILCAETAHINVDECGAPRTNDRLRHRHDPYDGR